MVHPGTQPERIIDSTGRETTVHKKIGTQVIPERGRNLKKIPPVAAVERAGLFTEQQEDDAAALLGTADRYITNATKAYAEAVGKIGNAFDTNYVIQSHQIEALINTSVGNSEALRLGRTLEHLRGLDMSDAEIVEKVIDGLADRIASYSISHSSSAINNMQAEAEHESVVNQFSFFTGRGYSAGF